MLAEQRGQAGIEVQEIAELLRSLCDPEVTAAIRNPCAGFCKNMNIVEAGEFEAVERLLNRRLSSRCRQHRGSPLKRGRRTSGPGFRCLTVAVNVSWKILVG